MSPDTGRQETVTQRPGIRPKPPVVSNSELGASLLQGNVSLARW